MAAAIAERERRDRGLTAAVDVVTGGTDPADRVHPVVVDAMAELGIDVADRAPRELTREELDSADYVVTMGCDAADVCPATWTGENRDWGLDDPHGKPLSEVRTIRDDVERRVAALFDELEG